MRHISLATPVHLLLFILIACLCACSTNDTDADNSDDGASDWTEAQKVVPDDETARFEVTQRCLLDSSDGRFIESVLAERCPDFGLGLRQNMTLAILEESAALGLDPMLLLGLIQIESRFDPSARSSADARGLLQLRLITARHQADQEGLSLSDEEIFGDPEWQVRLGARYLADQLLRFQRLEWALMAYNAGPTKLQRLLSQRDALLPYEGYPVAVLREKGRFETKRALFEEALQRAAIPVESAVSCVGGLP